MSTTTTRIEEEYTDDRWATKTSRYAVEGDLAERILRRIGLDTGQVVIIEQEIPTGYSTYTMWDEYEFTIEVDGTEVWNSLPQSQDPFGFGWNDDFEENIGRSNFAKLNDWLNQEA